MNLLNEALRSAQHLPPASGAVLRQATLLVLGAGGALGSALLAESLVAGRFARVTAVVAEPLASALRGLVPLPLAALQAAPAQPAWQADVAVIVFERQRHSNGRDDAFVQPQPADLLPLAQRLLAGGVRHLIVLLPHAPALLPQALRHGLASLDEGAVAALGFEHLVFVRAAQHVAPPREPHVVRRFAAWWLSQLRLMIPQHEQPVRAVALARCVAQLARQLPSSRPGTRVLAPEWLWQAAQHEAGLDHALQAWLGAAPAQKWRRNNPPMLTPNTPSTAAHSTAPAALQNDCFLRACLRQPTPHTPVWLMRQAGRYLPEYKATRAKAGNSFMGLATNPQYATDVTLQPLDRYPLDAAILFSDILTVPDAMGLGLSFGAGEGPRFAHPLRDEAAVAALRVPDMDKLRYVFDAVSSIRKALATTDGQGRRVGRVPLIGFSGSPWTLASYMVEGAGSDDYRLVKAMLYGRPDLMHRILDINAQAVTAYLNAQVDAGAQALMVFDSWGGVLADGAFQRFSLDYTRRVVAGLTRDKGGQRIPVIVFTKGGGLWLDEIADCGADVVGLDWTVNLGDARRRVGSRVALQGNLDPMVLFAPPDAVAREARAALDSFGPPQRPDGSWDGHIFNLGHGISQHTPPEHVTALVDAVHSHSRRLRGAA